MSQKFTQDGVELVVAGLREFENDMKRAGIAWDDTVQRFRKGGKFISDVDVGKAFKSLEGSAASVTPTLGNLASNLDITGVAASGMSTESVALGAAIGVLGGAAVMAAAKIGKEFVGAIRDAVGWMKQTVTQALMLAGEFQEMEFVALAVGRAMGKSRNEIESSAQQMVDLGIRTDVANKVVSQFIRYQLDMASAVDLVRVAQATAIMTQRDSSEEMDGLVHAALSGSTIMLRQRGIFIDADRAFADYAKTLGRGADTLTETEKAQARLNAIIEAGTAVLGVYDAAMKSPTKQLRTLTQREIPELLAQLGAPFLNAFATAVGGVREVVGALMEATREGGTLYPVLINLGAAASYVADGFAAAAKDVVSWIQNIDQSTTDGFQGVIAKMFHFGFELVAQFAEGIVSATVTVLVAAMNMIGWVLERFLGPGSPPKVALGITQWGIDAINEYLRGFTMGDWSILETIQDPLSRILKGPEFAEFSKEIIAALAGGEQLSAAFYERIAAAAGKFGQAVAELTRRRVELVQATDAATAAEKRLEKAQESLTKSQQQVTVERRKYNEMLREGATKAQLAAQMMQVRGAEEQARAALEEKKASEDAVDAAKDRQEVAKEQYDLQSKLVNQLLQLDKAQQEIEEGKVPGAPTVPKGAKEALEALGLEMPEPAAWDITSGISDAIDRAKAALAEKLKELFKPLTDAWAEIQKDLGRLGDAWREFKKILDEFWASPTGKGISEFFETLFPEGTLGRLVNWTTQALLLTGAFFALNLAIGFLFSPLGLLILSLAVLAGMWEANNDEIMVTIDQLGILSGIALYKASTSATQLWDIIKFKLFEALNDASTSATQLSDILDLKFFGALNSASTAATQLWEIIKFKTFQILVTVSDYLTETALGAWNGITTAIDNLKEAATKFWDWLTSHTFKFKINLPKLPDWAIPGSPLPIHVAWKNFAADMRTIQSGLTAALDIPRLYRQPRMVMAAPMGSTTTQHVTVDIGDVYISDREEGEMFQSRVEYAVLSALKRNRI